MMQKSPNSIRYEAVQPDYESKLCVTRKLCVLPECIARSVLRSISVYQDFRVLRSPRIL